MVYRLSVGKLYYQNISILSCILLMNSSVYFCSPFGAPLTVNTRCSYLDFRFCNRITSEWFVLDQRYLASVSDLKRALHNSVYLQLKNMYLIKCSTEQATNNNDCIGTVYNCKCCQLMSCYVTIVHIGEVQIIWLMYKPSSLKDNRKTS